jgi:DNA-binding CsgD family transcriptional regulator
VVPPWIHRLGVAVWVSDPGQKLAFLNPRAEALLGVRREDSVGRPCYELVASEDSRGRPFCTQRCSLVGFARGDQVLKPVRVGIRSTQPQPRWLELLIIPIEGPDGTWPWLVHCAQEVDRSHRIEQYLQRVASRSRRTLCKLRPLTPREVEVLELLAGDLSLDETALSLGIRRVTVRNHVQHILGKLGVHSIREAVALHLLGRTDPGKKAGPS